MTVAMIESMALPEGVYPIVEATLYLSTAPKSNTANDYFKAYAKVEAEGKVQVPKHLQDAHRDARDLGHGEGYVYPHAEPGHDVGQQNLPSALLGTYFYSLSAEGYEAQVKERLMRWRAAQEQALGLEQTEELRLSRGPKCSMSCAAQCGAERAARLAQGRAAAGWRAGLVLGVR
jgi:replication-associated recombination protein RarA